MIFLLVEVGAHTLPVVGILVILDAYSVINLCGVRTEASRFCLYLLRKRSRCLNVPVMLEKLKDLWSES